MVGSNRNPNNHGQKPVPKWEHPSTTYQRCKPSNCSESGNAAIKVQYPAAAAGCNRTQWVCLSHELDILFNILTTTI